MFVRSVMTEDVTATRPDQTLQEAYNLIQTKRYDALPVLDGRRVVGIIQLVDIFEATKGHCDFGSALTQKVSAVMVPSVITVGPTDPIEKAAKLMHDRDIPMLPVVNDGQLVGVVTEHDIFRAFSEVLGADTKAPRLTLVSPEVKGRLYRASEVCYKNGCSIISAATFKSHVLNQHQIVLRVDTPSPEKLAAKLAEAGFKVISIEE